MWVKMEIMQPRAMMKEMMRRMRLCMAEIGLRRVGLMGGSGR